MDLYILDSQEILFKYDENTYIPTCVSWSIDFEASCISDLHCTGDGVVGYLVTCIGDFT